MTFAERAAWLAGLAARALGWRPDEFWAATPAELALALGAGETVDVPPTRAELAMLIEKDSGHARCR